VNSSTASLKEVIADDAFVWRKLELTEWQNVVWENCAAHSSLLTSINVDARNIVSS